jgi:hypothetical protein
MPSALPFAMTPLRTAATPAAFDTSSAISQTRPVTVPGFGRVTPFWHGPAAREGWGIWVELAIATRLDLGGVAVDADVLLTVPN